MTDMLDIHGLRGGEQLAPLRELPHSEEAEQALFGAILMNDAALHRVADFLRAEHFYIPVHGRIYDAMLALAGRGQPLTPVTLARYFEADEALCDVGGSQYLARLAASAVTVINAQHYGRTILDLASRRAMIRLGNEMIEKAWSPHWETGPDLIASEAISSLDELLGEMDAGGRGVVTLGQAMDSALSSIEAAYKAQGIAGVTTGLRDLDDLLGGLHKGELIVLAARPGQGKTAMALGIAESAAKAGHQVAFLTLEMTADQLAQRRLASATGISARAMRKGSLHAGDFPRLLAEAEQHRQLSLHLVDASGMTVEQCASAARRLHSRHRLGLVVVDYLQLIAPSDSARRRNRVDEVTEISAGLKRMARALDVPVLALAQLNRALEGRDNKRPRLSDLRDSGAIEQDADVIGFIHREIEYLRRERPDPTAKDYDRWEENCRIAERLADLFVEKHRQGPCGHVGLRWDAERMRFHDAPLPVTGSML
ncbi:MAG: replicative DNA helicase [Hyphomicrobiaceae bacterium]